MFFQHNRLIRKSEERSIVSAIKEAEKNTSGEIRVHIENKCPDQNPITRAIVIFDALGMFDTALRNGVLIYISLKSRKFAIIGDTGINAVVSQDFWDSAKAILEEYLKKGEVAEGIRRAVLQTGIILKEHFPYQQDDINELPDEISYGK